MKNKIIIIVIIFLILSIPIGIKFKNNNSYLEHVYSHRGASGEEIEHTIKAYDLAIKYGSKYIEQDIVSSKEKTLFVSHDLSAKRITNIDKLYKNMTDQEINKLRTKDNQKILKLEDVFKKYNKYNIKYVIELKDSNDTTEFIKLIKKYKNHKKIIVQCNNKNTLKRIKKVFPKIITLYLAKDQNDFNNSLNIFYINILSLEKKYMNKNNLNKAHKHNKKFNIWTLNTTEEIKNAIDIGIDSYFTNYTKKAIKLEKKYR